MIRILAVCLVLVGAIVITFTLPYIFGRPKACDLTGVSHRDFKHYYGLINVENPLLHFNAEQGENINNKCQLFYDHMHLFSSSNLRLQKSMIVQGVRGSGKTQVRQCIIGGLPPNNHILIKIYGIDINNYLNNFVHNYDHTDEPAYETIHKYWKEEHFLQIILTEIALRFVDEKYFSILKKKQDTIPLQTRKEIAILLSFYHTKESATLCTMVNLLLHEITECWVPFGCRIPCDNSQLNNEDLEMFISLSERHRKIKVKRQTTATDASLRLLVALHTKTKYSPLSCLDRPYRDQVVSLITFLTTLHVSTTVIVDSLDESTFFFDKADSTLRTLQSFVNSMTNDGVMHLALGNWGEGIKLANSFSFYILIPKRPTVPIKISWTRQDKIPIIDLKWDELQLINYADYTFDYLRTQSRDQCKTLPDICSLLGGWESCIDSMKQLRHPRDFHIFFNILLRHMGTVCTQRDPPFIATQEDLKVVLEETKLGVLDEKIV